MQLVKFIDLSGARMRHHEREGWFFMWVAVCERSILPNVYDENGEHYADVSIYFRVSFFAVAASAVCCCCSAMEKSVYIRFSFAQFISH